MLDNTLKRQGKAQKSGSCSFFPLLHALRRLYSGTLCQQHTRTVASTAQNHDGTQTLKLSRPFIYLSGISDAPEDLTAAYLIAEKIANAQTLSSLVLTLDSEAKARTIAYEATLALEDRKEGYTLDVPSNGGPATLTAATMLGLLRGLTTFTQIWFHLSGDTYTLQAPFQISDSSAFPYRGLMLDTARNYFPVADIKRTLDAMSWAKIGIFHWHLSGSQSFPMVILGYAELAARGAYDSDSIYTPKDVKEIVEYANSRGIDVVPEIDTPGHTMIIGKAFPEHIACMESTPWWDYAAQPPAGQLRLASPATTNFTASLLTAAASLFETGKYFNTGGDELKERCYEDDPQTQADLAAQGKTLQQAYDTFTAETHGRLRENGKTAIGWEEMLLSSNLTLSRDTLLLAWKNAESATAIAKRGFKHIHAESDYFYLDCGMGTYIGQWPDGDSWCAPFKSWQRSYIFDPTTNLTAGEAKNVMGCQHLLWTEQSSPANLDSITWPCAASAAEVFWSGLGGDLGEALPRLTEVVYRYSQRGVNAISLQPEWCALGRTSDCSS